LRAANGKIIADSGEGYVSKSDCQHGIELVKERFRRYGGQGQLLSHQEALLSTMMQVLEYSIISD
jgi:Domain of unknown function (DUF1508)